MTWMSNGSLVTMMNIVLHVPDDESCAPSLGRIVAEAAAVL
jgi:hypothetical protein